MRLIAYLLINGFAVFLAAYLLPGVNVDGFFTAMVVAVVLGLVNTFLKPVLVILTLPITLVTLGLFYLVINALLIMLVTYIVPGFSVENFWWALLFSLVISVVSWFLNQLAGEK